MSNQFEIILNCKNILHDPEYYTESSSYNAKIFWVDLSREALLKGKSQYNCFPYNK